MKGNVKRVSAEGLRTSDPTVLSILIQDLLHTPIDKLSALDISTLVTPKALMTVQKLLDVLNRKILYLPGARL